MGLLWIPSLINSPIDMLTLYKSLCNYCKLLVVWALMTVLSELYSSDEKLGLMKNPTN